MHCFFFFPVALLLFVSTAVVDTAEATIPAVARYPAIVVTAAGKAMGAANIAPPIAPKIRPALRIFLKNEGVGELMRFDNVIVSFFIVLKISGNSYQVRGTN